MTHLGSRRAGRLVALPLALLVGCQGAPSIPASGGDARRAARIEALRAQVATRPEIERAWGPYFRELGRLNAESVQLPTMFLRETTEGAVHDAALVDGLIEAWRRDPAATGPISTILDVARQCRERGIDFLVMPVPPRSVIYPELILPELTPLSPGELPPLMDVYLRRFYLELEENGVEVVDLLPAFLANRYGLGPPRGKRKRRYLEMLYMNQDPHWAGLATRVAGTVLAERIKQYPWYPETAALQGRAHVINADSEVKQLGATAQQLVEKGKLDIRHPREHFIRTLAYIDGETWSFEDPGSPILLLGDSYSIPYWGFPDEMLRRLRFRVDLIAVEGGYQSSQLRALKLRGNGLQGKKLVIWELSTWCLGNPPGSWLTAEVDPLPSGAR